MPDTRDAFPVTWCTSCAAWSALEVRPGLYCCAGCSETGVVGEGDGPNVAHAVAQEALQRALKASPSPVVAEFTALARVRLATRLREVK